MSIKLNKKSYITLIENDIAMVETHLPDCMEQNHIEAVLRDSVNHYYPKCDKKEHPSLEENSAPINNSRIIKFRGKRLFNGEWAEGSYIQPNRIIVLDEGEEVEVYLDTVWQNNLTTNKMKQLNELAKEIFANATAKGFYERPAECGTKLMLVVSELSEALEADRKDKRANLKAFDSRCNVGGGLMKRLK